MPRVKPIKHYPRLRVDVETRKCTGSQIRCVPCGYTGPADVVRMTSRRNGKRSLERCPACMSLNIVCDEVSVMEETKWQVDKWENCYPSNWKGEIIPAAMSHPAKFSSRLIRRIYEHLFEQGWVGRGAKVLDPFGGVALGALHAMQMGLHWVGNELEPKFVELGAGYDCPGFSKHDWVRFYGRAKRVNFSHDHHWCPECLEKLDSHVKEISHDLFSSNGHGLIPSAPAHRFQGNIDLWNATYGAQPHWGTAVLLQGDSRKLTELLKSEGRMQNAVSSPPFEQRSADGGWQMLGKYAEQGKLTVKQVDGNASKSYPSWDKNRDTSYGDSAGQMANMKTSEQSFQASLSSPPYTSNVQVEKNSTGVNIEKQYATYRKSGGGQSFEAFVRTQELHSQGYGDSAGQMANMKTSEQGFQASLSSPPYKNAVEGSGLNINKPATFRGVLKDGSLSMGESDGNLGIMDDGNFDAAISSPPFRHSEGGTPEPKPGGVIDERLYARHAAGNSAADGYGTTEGQLANMKERSTVSDQLPAFRSSVSSPPFADSDSRKPGPALAQANEKYGVGTSLFKQDWTPSNGNIANDSGDDFWLAARQIVEQVFILLEPGGHACWVVKDFVRNKERVAFSDQWRQLCEAVGFVTLHEHRAMLVHHKGSSLNFDGEVVEHKTESKSFFRRIAERKGSPRVDWEVVWCMEKPL